MYLELNPYEQEDVEDIRESLFHSIEYEDSKRKSKEMQEDYDFLASFIMKKEEKSIEERLIEKSIEEMLKFCAIMRKYKDRSSHQE